jgi:hypothetical protein
MLGSIWRLDEEEVFGGRTGLRSTGSTAERLRNGDCSSPGMIPATVHRLLGLAEPSAVPAAKDRLPARSVGIGDRVDAK